MTAERGTTPLFVYGTLKAGEALSGLLPSAPHRYHATCKGHLHYAPNTRGYPVFVPDDEGDKVDGEVLWVNLDDPDVAYVVVMELSSGYSAKWLDVCFGGDDKAYISALVFTWNAEDGLGDYIPSADWSFRDVREGRAWYCIECGEQYATARDALDCEWQHDNDDLNDAMAHALAHDRT